VARLLEAIMDLVFMIGMVYAIARAIRGILGGASKSFNAGPRSGRRRTATASQGRTVRDPECGMFVSTEVSHRLTHGNEILHFCSQDCLEKYERKMAKV
jgi:YHS domain-containing protein